MNITMYDKNMAQADAVGSFMTKHVVVAHPDMPLLEAANIMLRNNFTGLPVVDQLGIVVGILTEYDLLTKGSAIHLPTFLKLMSEFSIYRKDQTLISDDLKKILGFRVQDVMNNDPLVLVAETSIEKATRVFAEHHKINPIPIVDGERQLVGILSRSDIIKFYGNTEPHHLAARRGTPYITERAVKEFITSFEKNFVAVSRFRARYWFWLSAAFLIVGIIIATIFILRVDINL